MLTNLSHEYEKSPFQLGVCDKILASNIKSKLNIDSVSDEIVLELVRGIRLYAHKLLKGLVEDDITKTQLGLGHNFSRSKVQFNINRVDNMIIQAIALLDQTEKDINTFYMRIKEWYSWHFPELSKIVLDIKGYSNLVLIINDRTKMNEIDHNAVLDALGGDKELTSLVLEAAKTSMGSDISPLDLINVKLFSRRLLSLFSFRQNLQGYLHEKMAVVAPNLASLIGDVIGARLISHAGSLSSLAKYPASTVQILGAEKALFRALKTKGKTPKYGLIYHSSFIGKSASKHKGRISRYLANKCSIASRIDCFSDSPSDTFGNALRTQVNDRISFFENGLCPSKNISVMHEAMQNLKNA